MKRSRRNKLLKWLHAAFWRRPATDFGPRRGPVIHVIILDGTMSSLEPGLETNAGLTYRLCREMGAQLSIYYEPGIQWQDWRSAQDVFVGRGINRMIRRTYGYLASRYRPGDRIFLFGYSRGAYAVRSLAGMMDLVGLLRAEDATERNIRDVYRHYQGDPDSGSAQAFAAAHCLKDIPIEMIGVWDTVKSLGLNLPVLWRFSTPKHDFHNHEISDNVRAGFQALALDETRTVYAPVLWTSSEDREGVLEQVWFPGTHGDVGGQIDGVESARPLANIPLVWMLEKAEGCGLPLPPGWRQRFPMDPTAPSIGRYHGYGKFFLGRRPRVPGADPSERLHESVFARRAVQPEQRGFVGLRRPVRDRAAGL
ncbi:DUF2235 domain-containing protein [Sulfitobacter sp. D35]|uniref:DUF2235 domain-containing protein n=1 Tax=Sulfitobacter sp. D35 TaxID=3083252 RepID=UPI00296E76E0|nr:DUF2235 domain-containing protein [Sulfitobacter sp. D35]MDW4497055.1 DUF2235 domain-containing protein [Sulfitobacter sp. D35]